MRGRFSLAASIVGVSLALSSVAAWADPGDLDVSFGDRGRVRTNPTPRNDSLSDVAVQPNGKIVVVGRASPTNPYADIVLARYRENGTLDPAFGRAGVVTRNLAQRSDGLGGVAIQDDGAIVAVGGVSTGARTSRFVVLRVLRDGSFDDTFSGNGIALTGFGDGSDEATDVAIQDDAAIVVVGQTGDGEFALARYGPDGALDATFGGGDGKVTADPTIGFDIATGVAIQADGAIVVSGVGGDQTLVAMRFATDGTPDPSFDGDGVVTVDAAPGEDGANAVAIQDDGGIVLAGEASGCCEYTGSFLLVRLDPQGALDPTFGGDGIVITGFGQDDDGAADVAIQANGKIVAVGSEGFNGLTARFAIVRYGSDGSRDQRFGDHGKVVTRFSRAFDFARAAALDPDGRIVAVGSTSPVVDGIDGLFALARYRA